jgi:branched-chain amino acid transport system substrate-binding protein
VPGERVDVATADDYRDGEQAVAGANKLIARDVAVVIGHNCSGAAIPACRGHADAGVLMITAAVNEIFT